MNIIFIFISFFFAVLTLKNILLWVNIWQIKEYRLDRLLSHFKETIQGKELIFSSFSILKLLIILAYAFVMWNFRLLISYQIFVGAVLILEMLSFLRNFPNFKRPVFTAKAILIIFLSFGILSLLYFVPFVDLFLWILILNKMSFIAVSFFIFLISFPTNIIKDIQIERAIKKIDNHKKLLVIGITGSYGKSSTKDYVAQLLEKKFKVIKTLGTNNTEIGVANTVLSKLKKDTQIFVVEMGAYKKGEIAEICEIVKPKIGIITGINNQHLSLFKSIENTKKTKYELIESLPRNGLSVFNGNNSECLKLYESTVKKKIIYRLSNLKEKRKVLLENRVFKGSVFAYNPITLKKSVRFNLLLNGKDVQFETNLLGTHAIENILPAIYIASHLGITISEIKESVFSLLPLSKTMRKYKLNKGAAIIDDSFNANPKSVYAALNYIKIYKGKKIMVLQPMIELGPDGKEEHEKIGKAIGKICSNLFLTNKNFLKQIRKGLEGTECGAEVLDPLEIYDFISENTGPEDVVVFEGKEAGNALKKLEYH